MNVHTNLDLTKWLQQKCLWCTDIMKKAERPQRMEHPSGDVCRTVKTFSRKVLKIRVVRTGRSRQADVRGGYGSTTLRAMHPIHKYAVKNAPHLFH